jgi:hypothetical protein
MVVLVADQELAPSGVKSNRFIKFYDEISQMTIVSAVVCKI